ncbi:MAG: hypothetical protein ACETWK_14000 [Candidatus Aminicenantaceae bacterium]
MNARLSLLSRAVLFLTLMITPTLILISSSSDSSAFQKGMAFPTWQSDQYCSLHSDESLKILVQNTCTEWIQLVPSLYQKDRYANEIFPEYKGRTARNECIRHAIQYAHSLGLKVMLKPHVDAQSGDWRGTFQPTNTKIWFENYRNMIKAYAELAQQEGVEIFSIGCEFLLLTTSEYTLEWRETIKNVREIYEGPLGYAANWGQEYLQIEFWDDLNYIGIDSYFVLTDKTDPELSELLAAWWPYLKEIEAFYEKWKRPIILTEIGYRSIDGANIRPWDWETPGTLDLKEQALCYQAVIKAFDGKPWLEGIYWWNWEPDPHRGGLNDRGYTPQGKSAESILKRWYCELSGKKKGQKRR